MTDERENFWEFYVAGVKFHKLADVISQLEEGDVLDLILEPTNEYDKTAVRIELEETMLGYVPSKISSAVTAAIQKTGGKAFSQVGSIQRGQMECMIIKLRPDEKPWQQLMVRVSLP